MSLSPPPNQTPVHVVLSQFSIAVTASSCIAFILGLRIEEKDAPTTILIAFLLGLVVLVCLVTIVWACIELSMIFILTAQLQEFFASLQNTQLDGAPNDPAPQQARTQRTIIATLSIVVLLALSIIAIGIYLLSAQDPQQYWLYIELSFLTVEFIIYACLYIVTRQRAQRESPSQQQDIGSNDEEQGRAQDEFARLIRAAMPQNPAAPVGPRQQRNLSGGNRRPGATSLRQAPVRAGRTVAS
jgi:hypothetical protein